MRRPQILDPKTLRKHSRIVQKQQEPTLAPEVVGDRTQTPYGYTIPGYKGPPFETKFMVVMPATLTPKWLHVKKNRVLRVVTGVGDLETFDEGGEVTTKKVTAGDEVVAEAGTAYRFRTRDYRLEFYVTQDYKYESSLKELEAAESIDVPESELQSIQDADKQNRTNMVLGVARASRRNLARAQIAENRGQQRLANAEGGQRPPQSEEDFFRGTAAGVVNVMPVRDFDPDGAG